MGVDPRSGEDTEIIPKEAIVATTSSRSAILDFTRTSETSDPVYGMGWIRDSFRGHQVSL